MPQNAPVLTDRENQNYAQVKQNTMLAILEMLQPG